MATEYKDETIAFYCDECGKCFEELDYEDTMYYEPGKLNMEFYIGRAWYKLNKIFCDDCAKKFVSNLKAYLENIGFER